MRSLALGLAFLVAPLSLHAQTVRKPVIVVEKDGYPSGHTTPEGVACDLARSFIKRDAALFKSVCIAPFGGGEGRKKYEAFLKKLTEEIAKAAKSPKSSTAWPKSIMKLFASRPLTNPAGAKAARSGFNFKDIQFVEVGALFTDGSKILNQTFVIRSSDGKWYVHPLPNSCPTLSIGLDQESPSSLDFKEFYTISKLAPQTNRKPNTRR